MEYETLLELVKKRRSIRRFKSDPIPDKTIEKMLEVARWAPSGFNMQPWEFIVVRKPELKEKIVDYIKEYWDQSTIMETAREPWQGRKWKLKGVTDSSMDYTSAPVYIILYGDTRIKAGLPMGVRYSSERCQMIFQASLANTFMYMHLAATTLGLAAQWLSQVSTPFADCMIKDLLGIPNELEIFDMMAVGYPALKPSGKFMRDPKKMVHYDDCGIDDFRDDNEVKDYVKRARNWTIGAHHRKKD